ncbi:MAG: hypothetical protein ACREPT_05545 [Rudaea sp.]
MTGIYTPTTDTVNGAIDAYAAQITASPLSSAVSNFFTLNASGTCPNLTVPSAGVQGSSRNIWAGLNGNFLCDGTLATILELMGYVVLAAAAFQSVRIAIY